MVTGCSEDKSASARPYSVEDVQTLFEAQTGDELRVERSGHDIPILGNLVDLGVGPELKGKYGDFAVVVFERLDRWKRRQLDGGRRPGSDGIVWTYHPAEKDGDVPSWFAGKYYGNVVLTWVHPTKETTEQWERLDHVLSLLAAKRL
jgi:hypothetical protein